MKTFLRILSWWPSGLTFATVLWLTLSPDPVPQSSVPLFAGADKIVHAIMMGGLTGAVIFDYKRNIAGKNRPVPKGATLAIACGVALFSCIDEVMQQQMHLGRSGDVADLVADLVGIAIAALWAPRVVQRLIR